MSLFEVHVMLHRPRARSRRATPSSADLVYHVDAGAGRLVTRAVDAGHTYTISAMATNILGPSNNQLEDGEFKSKYPVATKELHVQFCKRYPFTTMQKFPNTGHKINILFYHCNKDAYVYR